MPDEYEEKAKQLMQEAFTKKQRKLYEKKKQKYRRGSFAQDRDTSEVKPPEKEEVIEKIPEEKKQRVRTLRTAAKLKEEGYPDLSSKITGTHPEQLARAKLIKREITGTYRSALKELGEWEEVQQKKGAAQSQVSRFIRHTDTAYSIRPGKVTQYRGGEKAYEKVVPLEENIINTFYDPYAGEETTQLPGVGEVLAPEEKGFVTSGEDVYEWTGEEFKEREQAIEKGGEIYDFIEVEE